MLVYVPELASIVIEPVPVVSIVVELELPANNNIPLSPFDPPPLEIPVNEISPSTVFIKLLPALSV